MYQTKWEWGIDHWWEDRGKEEDRDVIMKRVFFRGIWSYPVIERKFQSHYLQRPMAYFSLSTDHLWGSV